MLSSVSGNSRVYQDIREFTCKQQKRRKEDQKQQQQEVHGDGKSELESELKIGRSPKAVPDRDKRGIFSQKSHFNFAISSFFHSGFAGQIPDFANGKSSFSFPLPPLHDYIITNLSIP